MLREKDLDAIVECDFSLIASFDGAERSIKARSRTCTKKVIMSDENADKQCSVILTYSGMR